MSNRMVIQNVRPWADGKFQPATALKLENGIWSDFPDSEVETFDAGGACAIPALFAFGIDFQEPVRDDIYTFEDGFKALRRGGFSGGLYESAANPIDDLQKFSAVAQIVGKSKLDIRLLGAISKDFQGEHLAEMLELSQGGVAGFGDGNRKVGATRFLRLAMEYGSMTGKRFFFLPMDYSLKYKGLVHEGPVSDTLGMKGIPKLAETIAVHKISELALWLKIPVHFKQITCGESLELIARAKERGLDVTCDVSVYHLLFDESHLFELDSHLNLHPPVRSALDREALWNGLSSGLVQAISCNHFPVLPQDKEVNFEDALPGALSLEILLPALWNELESRVGAARAIELLSSNPALLAGVRPAALKFNAPADFVLFRPEEETFVTPSLFSGQVHNTPLLGKPLRGRILGSYLKGFWSAVSI